MKREWLYMKKNKTFLKKKNRNLFMKMKIFKNSASRDMVPRD